jgi:hypothetical protein
MTTKQQIERPAQVYDRLGVGPTQWHEKFKLRDASDPFVPGTDETVKRVRAVPLGDRAVGYFADEIDELIAGLRRWRDRAPVTRKPAVPNRGKQKTAARRHRAITSSKEASHEQQ